MSQPTDPKTWLERAAQIDQTGLSDAELFEQVTGLSFAVARRTAPNATLLIVDDLRDPPPPHQARSIS